MTTQEFIDEIKFNYGEDVTQYTDDDIVEIGLSFRDEVEPKNKNWSMLVDFLDIDKSAEAFRTYMVRKSKERAEQEIVKGVIKEETDSELIDKKDFITKQQVRDAFTAYRRGLREESRIDSFKDSLVSAVKSLPELPQVEYDDIVFHNDVEAVLMLSDLHIGVCCSNFYNTYNKDIAYERLMNVVDKTIKYCKLNNVETLHILNMGDMIQGIIHTSARLENELDVTEQIVLASEYLAQALNKLQEAAINVTYRSVFDNHSRAIANLKEHIEKEQFSRIIDWYLETRLENTSIKFMYDNIDGGIGKFTLKNGKKIMFAHGHNDSINNSFQNYVGATKEFIDYILLAHYHSEKSKSFQGCKVFVNGSLVGTEQYALSKRLFSEPSQTLLVFSDDDLVNYSLKA